MAISHQGKFQKNSGSRYQKNFSAMGSAFREKTAGYGWP